MMEESVVQLTGDIDLRVDTRPIDRLEHKLRGLMRLSDAIGRKIGKNLSPDGRAMNKLAAQTKQQFAVQMQASKFALVQQQQQTKLGTLQTKQALEQAKVKKAEQAAAVASATAQRRAQLDQLKAQGATLANKMKSLRLSDLEARIKARQQRAERNARRAPQAQTRFRNPFHGGGGAGRGGLSGHAGRLANNFGGFGRGSGYARPHTPSGGRSGSGARVGAGVGFPALGGLAMAATGAAVALAAMAAVAFKFVSEAERAANAQQIRNAQFKAATGSEEGAKGMEARYQKLADYLGLNANEGGRDYAKLTGALSKKFGVDQAEKTASGIMSYGKAQGMTQDEMKLLNRGLLQSLGKNQLYAEEWTGQISEHLGANANQYGAEAYQRAIGGKKTGQAAEDQFRKDREDKKIRGDVLQKFLKEFGDVLAAHANDGGALDVARQTQESRKARFANQMSENLTHAYNNSGLKEATGPMYENAQGLLKALGPQFDKFATWSADSVKMLSQGLKLATEFVDALNSSKPDAMNDYFNPESIKAFKSAWNDFTASMQDRFKVLGELWTELFGETTAKGFASGVLDVLTFILKAFNGISNVISSIIKESVAFVQWAKKNVPGLGGSETAGQDAIATPGNTKTAPGTSMLAPKGNQTGTPAKPEVPATQPAQAPLVVPQTPSIIPPAVKANMAVMSVPPASAVNPPVVQPAPTTNNTTVNNNVTVQAPNIKIDGSNHTPEEIAQALGSKLQGLATKAVEDSWKQAAASQVDRYGQ